MLSHYISLCLWFLPFDSLLLYVGYLSNLYWATHWATEGFIKIICAGQYRPARTPSATLPCSRIARTCLPCSASAKSGCPSSCGEGCWSAANQGLAECPRGSALSEGRASSLVRQLSSTILWPAARGRRWRRWAGQSASSASRSPRFWSARRSSACTRSPRGRGGCGSSGSSTSRRARRRSRAGSPSRPRGRRRPCRRGGCWSICSWASRGRWRSRTWQRWPFRRRGTWGCGRQGRCSGSGPRGTAGPWRGRLRAETKAATRISRSPARPKSTQRSPPS